MLDVQNLINEMNRFIIGADSLTRHINSNISNYDIVKKDENSYILILALPGFSKEDVNVEVVDGYLEISGSPSGFKYEDSLYLHKGIQKGSFRQRLKLNDNMEVKDAIMENGLLKIHIERVKKDEDRKLIEVK